MSGTDVLPHMGGADNVCIVRNRGSVKYLTSLREAVTHGLTLAPS